MTSMYIITFQKSFVDLKSTQNMTLKYPGLHVKHSIPYKHGFSYFILSYATKFINLIDTNYTVWRWWLWTRNGVTKILLKTIYCHFHWSSQCNQQNVDRISFYKRFNYLLNITLLMLKIKTFMIILWSSIVGPQSVIMWAI